MIESVFIMKKIIIAAPLFGIICLSFAACKSTDKSSDEITYTDATDKENIDWADDPTVGIVQPGYYQRIGIVKKNETYEEMLELNKIAAQGFLIVNDDGTATFELDGEKTEYVYDKFCLYLAEDTERTNGIPYVYIGGRLVVNDGSTVTQYLKSEESSKGK